MVISNEKISGIKIIFLIFNIKFCLGNLILHPKEYVILYEILCRDGGCIRLYDTIYMLNILYDMIK